MGAEMYDPFTQCLTEDIKNSWEETLKSDYTLESQRTYPNWDTTQDKFMERYLNYPKPQNIMLCFMKAGVTKNAMTPCLNHYRRWKESLQNAKKLPTGVKLDPTNKETKEWFCRSFRRPYHNAFLTAGNKIKTSLMEEIWEFMHLHQKEDLDNDTRDSLSMNLSKRCD